MKTPAQTPIVFRKVFKSTAVILLSLVISSYVFAQDDPSQASPADARRQAVYCRNQGIELQNKGDLDGAMSAYKKAVEADPSYALAYNDMGVVNEARGMYKQAEQQYLKAVDVDPACAGAYSNLALLKEEQRELDKARFYWKKRVDVGDPNDPWTIKAKEKVCSLNSPAYSLDNKSSSLKDEFQQQARFYREEGLKAQKMGNLPDALSSYMKAQQLDPTYAVVYNDIGVIYETQGNDVGAEANYLKALDIDPNMASVYTNLALFYEDKRDLSRALYYWQKRQQRGDASDPWTVMAQRRSRDIRLVTGSAGDVPENDVLRLVGAVVDEKECGRKDNIKLGKTTFYQAQEAYKKGDEVKAFKKAVDAHQLDPDNGEILSFVEQTQQRLLAK